jgi:DNA processing protein
VDTEAWTIAIIALLREGQRGWSQLCPEVEAAGAEAVLDAEVGLLAGEAREHAAAELRGWRDRGIRVIAGHDDAYPASLQTVSGRPPLLFVAGGLDPEDDRAVAVVGSRQASDEGRRTARAVARHLVNEGYTVTSGLAAGIDTEAHVAALDAGGRTVAVLGSGLDHCYPAHNAELARRILSSGALVSQFWPESRPSRQTFPMRNAVMAGMTRATVIVEAGMTSGTRVQARVALAEGRVLILLSALLRQPWAQELARRPGVVVVESASEVVAAIRQQPLLAYVA